MLEPFTITTVRGLHLESVKSKDQQRPSWLIEAQNRALENRKRIFGTQDSTSPSNIGGTEAGLKPSAPTTEVPVTPTESTAILPESLFGGAKKKFSPSGKEELLKTYRQKIEERKMLRARSFPFISEAFHPEFRLCQGLIVVGALTGQSKSTTNANLLASFLSFRPKHRAIAITNEESMDSVYNRVSCIRLGYNFNRYHTGALSEAVCQKIEAEAEKLVDRIEVICSGDWDMTYLEDVQAVLNFAAENPENIGLVTLDYFQTITSSRLNRTLEPVQVHKKMGFFLKTYGTKLGAPIVCFVQLKPDYKDSAPFSLRVQNDATIANHASDCVEIIPDFKAKTTKFIIRKNRFGGLQDVEVVADFKEGTFVFRSEEKSF